MKLSTATATVRRRVPGLELELQLYYYNSKVSKYNNMVCYYKVTQTAVQCVSAVSSIGMGFYSLIRIAPNVAGKELPLSAVLVLVGVVVGLVQGSQQKQLRSSKDRTHNLLYDSYSYFYVTLFVLNLVPPEICYDNLYLLTKVISLYINLLLLSPSISTSDGMCTVIQQ